MKPRLIGLLAITFAILPAVAFAEVPFTLNQAQGIALENSPRSFAVARQTANRLAESYEAEQFENPELEVDATVSERNSSRGISAELTYPLKPSQFGTRQSMARAIREIGSLEERMQTLALMHSVTEAYLNLWSIQQHKDFLTENLEFARSTNATISKAAKRGEVTRAASSLFNAEVLKYEDELLELTADENAAQIRLFKLINAPLRDVRLSDPALASLPEQIDPLSVSLPRDILLARLSAAELREKVARQDSALPELSPRFKYREGFDDNSREFSAGLRLQLPFGTPSKGERTRAEAERQLAKAQLAAFDNVGFDQLLRRALDHARLMHGRKRQYQDNIVPAYEEGFQALRTMFRNGQASVIELWQYHERLHEAELKRLEIMQHAFKAEMELEALTGLTLADMTGEGE